MKWIHRGGIALLFGFLILSNSPHTQAKEFLLKAHEKNWSVDPQKKEWTREYSKYFLGNLEITFAQSAFGDETQGGVSNYLEKKAVVGVDPWKIKDYIKRIIAPEVERPSQKVTIHEDEKGVITFDGFAFEGRSVDLAHTVQLIKKALIENPDEVNVSIQKTAPEIEVKSENLLKKGITTLLSTGETSFKGSPVNRTVNIHVGLDRFNGALIQPRHQFILGQVLGPVDEKMGYKKELVIKGDKTLPEFGGGLCQVSTTIYRGALWAGLPINQRRNHSYAVSYYNPQGLDATIYPPSVDLKFVNDTPGYLLLQTMTTKEGKAYVNYYGTPDERKVSLMGPRYYNVTAAPAPRTEYTAQLAPGEKQKLGEAHGGFESSWFRQVNYADPTKPPLKGHIYSKYEARPLYYLIGTSNENQQNNKTAIPTENGSS